MNNKHIVSFALLLCLALSVYLNRHSSDSINRIDRKDFSVADTSWVKEIKISSKQPEIAVLKRINENTWSINENFTASKSSIYYLLKTLQRMEVAYPIPLSIRDNVLGNLAVKGLKVEITLKDGQEKTFYVGAENKELTATYMMLENALEPYAVHIPGFNGYLSSRFFTNEYLWRDKTVTNVKPESITSIRILYDEQKIKKESFQLRFKNGNHQLNSINADESLGENSNADSSKINAFRASFQELYAEAFVMSSLHTDSLLKTKPICEIEVHTLESEKNIKLYTKATNEKAYDVERMYALIDDKDWMIVQRNTFKKILIGRLDFKE